MATHSLSLLVAALGRYNGNAKVNNPIVRCGHANLRYMPVRREAGDRRKIPGEGDSLPDCNRPLPTKPPVAAVAPPPLELPDYRRISGLAVLT